MSSTCKAFSSVQVVHLHRTSQWPLHGRNIQCTTHETQCLDGTVSSLAERSLLRPALAMATSHPDLHGVNDAQPSTPEIAAADCREVKFPIPEKRS